MTQSDMACVFVVQAVVGKIYDETPGVHGTGGGR